MFAVLNKENRKKSQKQKNRLNEGKVVWERNEENVVRVKI